MLGSEAEVNHPSLPQPVMMNPNEGRPELLGSEAEHLNQPCSLEPEICKDLPKVWKSAFY